MDPSPLAAPADPATSPGVPAAIADYVILRQLGEGNHGRYYLARPPARLELTEEFVALKVFGDRVGELAYDRILATLDDIGYRGWVGCEYQPRTTTDAGLGWVKKLGLTLSAT